MKHRLVYGVICLFISLIVFACRFRVTEANLLADAAAGTDGNRGKVICRDFAADVNTDLDKLSGQIVSVSQPALLGTPPVLCVSVTYK